MNPIRSLKRLEPVPLKSSEDLTNRVKSVEFYSISEVAKTLKCSKRHVDRLIDRGLLPKVMDISMPDSSRQRLRIPRESVDDYRIRNSAQ